MVLDYKWNPFDDVSFDYGEDTISDIKGMIDILSDTDILSAIKSYEKWQENEAFSEVEGWNVKPQFKTRMHEAAISRTINLVMKDNWNVAERYYKPNEDFLYFEDKKDLKNKIDDVLNNWKDYENMIENAYNKAMNYTTEKFVEKIRNDK